MAIMSSQQWKKDAVGQTTFFDSALFKEITRKLEDYHNPNAAGTPKVKLTALKNALEDWLTSKNGQASVRDKKNAIANLRTQIAQEVAASPSPLIGAGPYLPPSIAASAIAKAQARQARVEADLFSVSVTVSQHLDYRDGSGERFFEWDVYMTLTELPNNQLEVKVPIDLVGGGPDVKSNFKTQVESAWTGTIFRIPRLPPAKDKRLQLHFVLDWVANGTPDVFVVNVNNPPGIPAKKDYAKTTVGGVSTWTKQGTSSRNQDGRTMGTPDMGNWGAADKAAISHEFGHMIGNPDEYYTKKYMGVNVPGNIYDQAPFTTGSIMNNTMSTGRIHARHFYVIRDQYAAWKGISSNSIEVIVGK